MMAEVELDNEDGKWLPGALCQVGVTVVDKDKAISIPSLALVKRGPDAYAWVVDNGRARRLKLTLGVDLGVRIEVLTGLGGGELVIISGHAGLSEGVLVEVSEQEDRR